METPPVSRQRYLSKRRGSRHRCQVFLRYPTFAGRGKRPQCLFAARFDTDAGGIPMHCGIHRLAQSPGGASA